MIQAAKERDCAVCADTLRESQFPETRITQSCTHTPNTCLGCIQRHIEIQLETRLWNQLCCPECSALLGYADVEKYASKATFQRYDSLTMRDGISSDPNFRWCTASECNSGQVHAEGAESPLMICSSCRMLSCFTHQAPWHEGMTCVEFDAPESAQGTSEESNCAGSGGLLSSLAEICGRNREVVVGGVKRRETDQEKNDRKLAMRLFQEQDEIEKKRLQKIEQENRKREEGEVRSRKAQEERERQERELQQQREERQRQAREAKENRAKRQQEDLASKTLVQANTKACPGNCGWRIEKNDGCDHMTCWFPQASAMRTSHQVANLNLVQVAAVATNSAGCVSRLGGRYDNAGMHYIRDRATIILVICDAAA
jgi:IBR domain, a half RING-finger domain